MHFIHTCIVCRDVTMLVNFVFKWTWPPHLTMFARNSLPVHLCSINTSLSCTHDGFLLVPIFNLRILYNWQLILVDWSWHWRRFSVIAILLVFSVSTLVSFLFLQFRFLNFCLFIRFSLVKLIILKSDWKCVCRQSSMGLLLFLYFVNWSLVAFDLVCLLSVIPIVSSIGRLSDSQSNG